MVDFLLPTLSKFILTFILLWWIPTLTMHSLRCQSVRFHTPLKVIARGIWYFFFLFPIGLFNLAKKGKFKIGKEGDPLGFPSVDSFFFALAFMILMGYLISCTVLELLPFYSLNPVSLLFWLIATLASIFLTTRWWIKIFNQK